MNRFMAQMEMTNLAQRASSVQKQRAEDMKESGQNFINAIRDRIANNGNSPNVVDLIDMVSDIEGFIDSYETYLDGK